MKSRRPLRTRKPWQQTRVDPVPSQARRAADGPHPLEQGKYEIVARSGGMCEAATPDCQPGPHRGHHAHHIQLRSQGVNHGADNMLWVCSDAHGWIHRHTKESYANGWLAHPDRTIAKPGPAGYMKASMLERLAEDGD